MPPKAATPTKPPRTDAVEIIRDFNRFYTNQLGLLDKGLLGSPFSLTEARVLFELAHRADATASAIARELQLDFGYLSRLLKRFESTKLLERVRSPSDARQSSLALTKKGRDTFAELDRSAKKQVKALIQPLTADQRATLLGAMQTVHGLLQATADSAPPYSVRGLRIGDIGWVTRRQGMLYASEYGWDGTYEALVAEILAGFIKNFDPEYEAAWIAERNAQVIGSVFLVRASAAVAKLRLLYVEPSARGSGLGAHLVNRCIDFARAKQYDALTLWTNDVLISARRIYQAAGFELSREERHHSFGKDLTGQTWVLKLTA
jgi:DNA-binding MarR family transcriptional regulator/GNAT superfamily N-acetyltransferase